MLEEGQPIRFNMGCGQDRINGYMGVDMYGDAADIKQDITKLELPENCADEILASHVIEHLPQHRAPEVLGKWYDTLKPGGKIVLETPNLEALCEDFISKTGEEKHTVAMCMFGAYVDHITPETQEKGALSPHLWGYTPETLSDLCSAVGFTGIQVLPVIGSHPGKNFRLEAFKEAA
jgi:ubiquinone/menaquinone biosynthesis C-methylase UbiE